MAPPQAESSIVMPLYARPWSYVSRVLRDTSSYVWSLPLFLADENFSYVSALLKVLQAPDYSSNDTQHGERANLKCCEEWDRARQHSLPNYGMFSLLLLIISHDL